MWGQYCWKKTEIFNLFCIYFHIFLYFCFGAAPNIPVKFSYINMWPTMWFPEISYVYFFILVCPSQKPYINSHNLTRVIPIHKGDNATVSNNYRPISLLSIISKIIETCMDTKLVTFNNSNFGIMGNMVLGKNSTQKTTIDLITNMIDKPNKFEL